MAPMTLDEAKLIADCNRRLPGRASTGAPEATVVLAAALRESEARVEAAEKRAANAKREAFEEAARIIARDIRALKPEAKAETPPANERPPANPPRHYADAAFDGAPHYDPATPPATVRVVHRCNTDNGREVCTFEADHGGAHSWPPAFDARKAFQQLAIELQVDDRDFTDMRAMVAAALAAGSQP